MSERKAEQVEVQGFAGNGDSVALGSRDTPPASPKSGKESKSWDIPLTFVSLSGHCLYFWEAGNI